MVIGSEIEKCVNGRYSPTCHQWITAVAIINYSPSWCQDKQQLTLLCIWPRGPKVALSISVQWRRAPRCATVPLIPPSLGFCWPSSDLSIWFLLCGRDHSGLVKIYCIWRFWTHYTIRHCYHSRSVYHLELLTLLRYTLSVSLPFLPYRTSHL